MWGARMSLYYTFEVATELQPEAITQFLASEAGLERADRFDLRGQAVSASISAQDEVNQTIMYEDYGFRPTLNIVFYLHPSDGYEEGKNTIACATAALLRHMSGDATLLYNGEVPVLQRLHGELTVKEGWGDWVTVHLDKAGIPFERGDVVTPAV